MRPLRPLDVAAVASRLGLETVFLDTGSVILGDCNAKFFDLFPNLPSAYYWLIAQEKA